MTAITVHTSIQAEYLLELAIDDFITRTDIIIEQIRKAKGVKD